MVERTSFLYEVSRAFQFDVLVRDMQVAELSVIRPGHSGVWLIDGEGEDSVADLDELRGLVVSQTEQSFFWWFAEDQSVYCRIRNLGSVVCIELGMEGSGPVDFDRIGRALRTRFLSDPDRSIGWAFDPYGVAENYFWDRFFLNRENVNWDKLGLPVPAIFGLRRADCVRIHAVPKDVFAKDYGELRLLSPDRSWLVLPS